MTLSLECPIPTQQDEIITLAHGGGGKLSDKLIETVFLPAFGNLHLNPLHDGAFLPTLGDQCVMTTDSFVVKPYFFPGGDIGHLAVCGTLNDLSMCGAHPAYLSCAFILGEGFPIEHLKRIVASMQKTAFSQGVSIVTGDTKVIESQGEPECMIAMTGIGFVNEHQKSSPEKIQPNDAILVSGDIGRHGMAVMAARENLAFDPPILSDCAPLYPYVKVLQEAGIQLHCMRDLTRGGLAAALIELSKSSYDFDIQQLDIPVSEGVQAACEILGLNPLHVACEGRFVMFVPELEAPKTIEHLKSFSLEVKQIGQVRESKAQSVYLHSGYGTAYLLDKLTGEQLPRIC